MNRTKLKNYAPQARRDFIAAVTDRAVYYGLTKNKIEPITEQGDVAIIGGRAFPRTVAAKRRRLEERIARQGFDQVMEAMAYTWFNRLVAIRFMELHGYLDHGYRVLGHPEGKTTPEILEHAEHVDLPGLDKDKVIDLKLDGTKEAELYRLLLIAQCNALSTAMPFLFERVDDETELLLPDNLLHSDSLIRKLVNEIDEENWQEVEIIGWLYQFYISEKKDQVIGKVVKSEDIPAATQLFTPNWIVKYLVQNTLGRQWLATYPQSPLREKMEYYIEPAEQTPEVQAQLKAITPDSLNPEELTLLDPACGSGHILVEAYDLLKAIYLERGYRARDIPTLILQKNLFGLEIDDRAAQLAAFALMMKARADDRRIFSSGVQPHVLAIQESKGLNARELVKALNTPLMTKPLPPSDEFEFMDEVRRPLFTKERMGVKGDIAEEDVAALVELFADAKTFGSLIQVPSKLAEKLPAISQRVRDVLAHGDLMMQPAAKVLLPLIEQAWILVGQYDAVVTNPPYMGTKGMNWELKQFGEAEYPNSKSDIFAIFSERILGMVRSGGFIGMMTPFTWMFLKSYEHLRRRFLQENAILSLVQPEYHAFFESAYVPICAFIIGRSRLALRGEFIALTQFYGEDIQPIKTLEAIREPACGWRHSASAADFEKIPGSPILFSIPKAARDCFTRFPLLESKGGFKRGISTANNERFLRFWSEVDVRKIAFSGDKADKLKKWFKYNKGGPFRKWYGNQEYVIEWSNDGKTIRNYKGAFVRNIQFNGIPNISYSSLTSASTSFREYIGFINDQAGNFLPVENGFDRENLLGFLNSKPCSMIIGWLSATLNILIDDLNKIPYPAEGNCSHIVKQCLTVARADWESVETSWGFEYPPLIGDGLKTQRAEDSWQNWSKASAERIEQMRSFEEQINNLFIQTFGLQDELSPEVPEDQITLSRPNREEDIKRLLSYAIGCMMGRYSLDKPGLIYAHSGNKGFDHEIHKIYEKKKTECLSSGSCDSRDRCLSRDSYFSRDSCVSWFAPDPDGIIPLMETEWFSDDATHRLVEFISVVWPDPSPQPLRLGSGQASPPWGEGALLEENLKFIADSLGPNRGEQSRDTIRRYFATSFFKDHLKTYKRRPIYWLFSSGKQRAFQCLVYLHRYNEGTLSRMRTEYAIPLQGKIAARIDHLAADIAAAASTSHRRKLEKERDTLVKQQAELQTFDEKLRHYTDQRISLDLDDGVKVNYGKFGDLLAEVKAVCGKEEE